VKQTFKINEIFESIQGEGMFAGTPAMFVRFAGCNLSCPFCDTQHEKVNMELTADEIESRIEASNKRLVVFTGGEPTLQKGFRDLCAEIEFGVTRELTLAVETNGTKPNVLESLTTGIHITVSPKTYSSKEKKALEQANEIKCVYDAAHPWEKWDSDLEYMSIPKFIQPCSEDIKPALAYVLANPEWRLSVQLHKLLKVQ
jgi:7-carboxy-7-deazaguanine synthase